MNKNSRLNIIARLKFLEGAVLGRAYVHGYGIKSYAGKSLKDRIGSARERLNTILNTDAGPERIGEFSHFIAIIWGKERNHMIDFFGYLKENKWPGNPGVISWVTENGLFVPEDNCCKEITCEDGSIILGEEGRHRRNFDNLSDYILTPPKIEGVRLIIDDYKSRYSVEIK